MSLIDKIKELMGFGGPVTSVSLEGAKGIQDYTKNETKSEATEETEGTEKSTEGDKAEAESTEGFVNPNSFGETALDEQVDEIKTETEEALKNRDEEIKAKESGSSQ